MSIAIITGSAGLVGSETAAYFAARGLNIIGVDNDMRKEFFGENASTLWNRHRLQSSLKSNYQHIDTDVRNADEVNRVFAKHGRDISLIVHTAAQPSHDWAVRDPTTDFSVNATGTLNLLEAFRKHSPSATFIFTSTNKVYGDTPNRLPLTETASRWEIDARHTYANGIREDMSIDQTLHSLFGASKVAADILVQEYGRYFGLNTGCFRGGCLTGPNHSGTELHGFLSYLMKCAATGREYIVYGYQGKQVRDNIHCADLISAFAEFAKAPRPGEVYNIGGGRFSNASVLEAISMCESITEKPLKWAYRNENRRGDHIWWITDTSKFTSHYPNWRQKYNVPSILKEIYQNNLKRWTSEVAA